MARRTGLLAVAMMVGSCLRPPGVQAQTAPTLTLSADVAAPGAAVTATVTGAPGQFYALVGSAVGAGLVHAGVTLAVGTDFAILANGQLNGTGTAVVSVTPPFVFTSLDRYYLQAAASPSATYTPIAASTGRVVRNADLVGNLPVPPSRFGTNTSRAVAGYGQDCVMGQVFLTAGGVGLGRPANGDLLSISGNSALFSLLEFTFGGNGTTTFALPDLRAAAPNGTTYMICDQGIYPARRQ